VLEEILMAKVIKTFISNIKSVDEVNGIVEAVVSDETIDRYREVIKIDAWKKGLSSYKKHGVLLSSHDYSKLTNQIGIAESVKIVDKELVAKFKYFVNAGNEEADWGFFLAKQGLAAYSVGFLPKPNGYEMADWDDDDVRSGKKPRMVYTDVELLEVSQVTVPANPSALQKSLEGFANSKDIVLNEYLEKVGEFVFKKVEPEVIIPEIKEPEEIIDESVITDEIKTVNVEDNKMEEVLKAIEELKTELKTYIDTKFEKEVSIAATVIANDELKSFLEEFQEKILTGIKEKEVVVEPVVHVEEEFIFDEETENYLKQVLDGTKDLFVKHFSVQS